MPASLRFYAPKRVRRQSALFAKALSSDTLRASTLSASTLRASATY
ncbi:hypothetical protein ALTERO38_20160 [Alteromonas sp. 38]|nr:hypothetical protein ALTER154_100379 [Alteromonas sp. 154]VXA99685.1 hypothetical protein ALTERO38_20160 [Alteromonas sp. 38]